VTTSLEAMVSMLAHKVAALERQLNAQSARRPVPFALARTTLAVSDAGPVQTVQAQLDALTMRDNIPLLYGFGVTGSPPIAADLHVAFIDGDRSKAVAIASGHQTYRLRNLGLGDSALYDIRGAYVWLTAGGPSVNCAGNPMTVTGDLHVTGAVIAGYGGADQVGLQSHRHGEGTAAAGTTAPTAST
jgi:phage gp45-like